MDIQKEDFPSWPFFQALNVQLILQEEKHATDT